MVKRLSKSRYCSGVLCQKKLWLKDYMPEVADQSVINEQILIQGNEVGDLAMGLLGEFTEVPFSKDVSEMLPVTQKLIDEGVENIAEASFAYDGCFCSVDILKNLGNNKVEIYEVKSSTDVKPIYLDDISYQHYVLTKLGYEVEKVCVAYINNQYVRQGEIEIEKLFTIEDFTQLAKDKFLEVEENIQSLRKLLESKEEPTCEIGSYCSKTYECEFKAFCRKNLPKDGSPNVFDLADCRTKEKFYNQGLITFEQLYEAGVLKEKQLQQVEVELKNLPPQIDVTEIKKFLNEIRYPLYFLDFESFNQAIPPYDNSRPYEQLVFQYSLHYQEKENGELKHKECLAYPGSDPRRQIAEQLCKDIPLDSCVTAYNMSFEKTRIKEMAEIFLDLKDHLMNIHDNIVDIMIPFRKRWYYTKDMQGSYSIKYVLPALYPNDPKFDYKNLEGVHNGGEASETFIKMQNMEKSELEEWRKHLLKYCELDTYAMVKVLDKLREIAK